MRPPPNLPGPPRPPPPCPIVAGAHPSPRAPTATNASVTLRIICLLRGMPLVHRCADPVLRKEVFDHPSHIDPVPDRLRRGRQAFQNHLAVAFGDDAAVQEDYGAHVGLAANQSAE